MFFQWLDSRYFLLAFFNIFISLLFGILFFIFKKTKHNMNFLLKEFNELTKPALPCVDNEILCSHYRPAQRNIISNFFGTYFSYQNNCLFEDFTEIIGSVYYLKSLTNYSSDQWANSVWRTASPQMRRYLNWLDAHFKWRSFGHQCDIVISGTRRMSNLSERGLYIQYPIQNYQINSELCSLFTFCKAPILDRDGNQISFYNVCMFNRSPYREEELEVMLTEVVSHEDGEVFILKTWPTLEEFMKEVVRFKGQTDLSKIFRIISDPAGALCSVLTSSVSITQLHYFPDVVLSKMIEILREE